MKFFSSSLILVRYFESRIFLAMNCSDQALAATSAALILFAETGWGAWYADLVRPGRGKQPWVHHLVISIKSDDLILEAFKRMKDNRIGGLPVLDDSGRKIVASLSIQDIRFLLLTPQLFSRFRHMTVRDFVEAIDSTSSVLTCSSDDLLGAVIDSLASRKVHRVYVEKGGEVVGVVTLRDVISCFICEPPGYSGDFFLSSLKEADDLLNV